MASTSSLAFSSKTTYDVFLSFRGIDTRPTFTSHLYSALCRKSIPTFIDDDLERGERISPALLKAIEESMISVVIFSENYASSRWCLDELVKIIDCQKEMGRKILPIFYHVDPSDVRKQTGKFGEAFGKVKEKFKQSLDIVEKWSTALTEVANLSGWDSSIYRHESELIDKVVKHIMKKLYPVSFSACDDLVGIDAHLNEILSFLCIEMADVRFIGIWGIGGIGKTTIAEALFGQISDEFDACYFLNNVRESTEKHGLLHLRQNLFSKLVGDEHLSIQTPRVLPTIVLDILRRKKIFIVLDDVNDSKQLKALAGDHGWFGSGSRVIITSRDKQVLSSVDKIYEVKGLDCSDAFQLLSMKSFKQKYPPTEYIELSKRVQAYCKGVPLALEVLGSHLCKKTPEEWEIELNKLKRYPDSNIMEVLEISYNDLDEMEKKIFLYIACFFNGYGKSYVEDILNGCDFPTRWGIIRLVDKCLVTVVNNLLKMHDLIVEMGQDIARRKGIILCNSNDICDMSTSTNNEANKVEGLLLNVSEIGRLDLNDSFFSRMPNLRLLKFYRDCSNFTKFRFESNLTGIAPSLPYKLRLLHWEEFPFKSLPLNFSMENLVHLIMPRSEVEELWNGSTCFPNLKSLDLSRSKHLKIVPDFSMITSLEKIVFLGCASLIEIPSSIQCLKRLDYLSLTFCKKLRSLPQMPRGIKYLYLSYSGVEEWSPSSIQFFDNHVFVNISHCENLISLPRIIYCNTLRRLDISFCPNLIMSPLIIESSEVLPSSNYGIVKLDFAGCKMLKSLPNGTCELKRLEILYLRGCSNLEKLPPLYGLCSLKKLYLDGTALVEIPPDIFSLSSLELLSLSDTPMEELPSSIGCLSSLFSLNLQRCKKLKSLPNSICELKCLETLHLSGCSNLEKLPPLYGLCSLNELYLDGTALVEIPPDIVSLSSLALLYLNDTPMEELPSSIGCLSSLVSLNLEGCKKLKSLPNSICELKCLETLHLRGCSNLEKLPPLYGLCSLNKLYLDGTALVEIPPDIFSLSSLELLYLNDTPMEELPSSIGCLSSLVSLNLQRCKKLKSLPNSICELKCLETLHLRGCSNLEKLPPLYGLCSLKKLYLDGTALVEIPPDIVSLSSLELLSLSDTPMEELPSSIGCLSSLVSLNLQRCKKLKSLPNSICELKCLETLHLSGCSNLEKLPPLYGLCSLNELYLDGTALVEIPPDIVELCKCNPYICLEANFLEQLEETANANNKRSLEDLYSSNIDGNQEVETHPKRLRPNFFMDDQLSNFFEIRPY
ncbi:disease resistance protein RPV1 [Hevea brasiliensis]|uniref:disease resistance protein RPV1 n=1 Tax=Hevea brasiliensis TaxID=3981 RepID=UPI0025FF73C1|nr:disease resistance protein RPV1 [Hevea brasiliensis]